MARPDLPRGYGGWQAIDATPQERSGRRFQCGPASLAAVRAGMIGLMHDVAFVFAEVNSDVMNFSEDPESPWGYSRSRSNSYHVGRRIVTKALGQHDTLAEADIHDITDLYKMSESDPSERIAMMNAVRLNERAREIYRYSQGSQISAQLEEVDDVKFGDSFKARLQLENTSDTGLTLDTLVTCTSLYYNGVPAHRQVGLNPIKSNQIKSN